MWRMCNPFQIPHFARPGKGLAEFTPAKPGFGMTFAWRPTRPLDESTMTESSPYRNLQWGHCIHPLYAQLPVT